MDLSIGKLFMIFLKVGAFTFGGGYAMIPIIERELVHRFKLVSPEEFYDTLVICQSLPGPIAVNFSVFIGLKLKGLKGAFAGLLGVVLPSFVIILLVSIVFFQYIDLPYVAAFFKGVRISVIALIFYAGYKLLKNHLHGLGLFVMILTFGLLVGFHVHPVWVIFIAGLFGYLVYTVGRVIRHDHI